MDTSVIVLDSDDEDISVQEISKVIVEVKPTVKRSASNDVNGNNGPMNKIRRIQPTKIGEIQDKSTKNVGLNFDSLETTESSKGEAGSSSACDLIASPLDKSQHNSEGSNGMMEELKELKESQEDCEAGPSTSNEAAVAKNELTQQMKELIEACRAAEPSAEMKQVIKKKLLKYYHSVHPDYVTSKNFLKSLKAATEEIRKEPHLVYTKLQAVIEELDARRKSKATVVTTEESVEVKGTGDEKKDENLKRLYRGLLQLKRQITVLEEAEVDWEEDDNSSYLKKVRFEKRACEIYEQICQITGESTHAHRIVKKPITFKGTDFHQFNAKLQKIVNKKQSFPNFLEVLKCLDYCNKKHEHGLAQDQLKPFAQDAFEKLGKTLQKRRKDDLYESTTFYVGKTKDPAKEDPELRSRLEKNKKFYAKCDDIINEFAEKEQKAASDDAEEVSSTSKNEPLVEELKEVADETAASPENDLNKPPVTCDKNDPTTTTTSLDDDDDDLMIIS